MILSKRHSGVFLSLFVRSDGLRQEPYRFSNTDENVLHSIGHVSSSMDGQLTGEEEASRGSEGNSEQGRMVVFWMG